MRSTLHGEGLFETVRCQDGRMPVLEAHGARLGRGLKVLSFPDVADEAIKKVRQAAPKTGAHLVRVQVHREGSFDEAGPVRIDVSTRPAPARRTLTAVTSAVIRDPVVSSIKHISMLPTLLALQVAREKGVDDVILSNRHGRIAEASTSNVYAVVDGDLHGPGEAEDALAGTTQALVARRFDVLPTLTHEQLAQASEVFVTSAGRLAWSIVELDGRSLPEGPVTQRVQARLDEVWA